MPPMWRWAVSSLLLLFVAFSRKAAASPCHLAPTIDIPSIDGIHFPAFVEKQWLEEVLCAKGSVDFFAGQQTAPPNWRKLSSSAPFGHSFLPKGTLLEGLKLWRSAQLTATEPASLLNVTVAFHATLVLPAPLKVKVELQGKVEAIVAVVGGPQLLGKGHWKGGLALLASHGSKLRIFDANPFDGRPPRFGYQVGHLSKTAGASTKATFSQLHEEAIAKLSNVDLSLGPFATQPSAFMGTTRGALLNSTGLQSTVELANLWMDSKPGFSSSHVALVASTSSCTGSTCPESLVASLADLLKGATGQYCTRIDPTPTSVTSSLKVDSIVSDKQLSLRGLDASTTASFQCTAPTTGSIDVKLSVTLDKAVTIPHESHLASDRTIAYVAKSMTFTSDTTIKGILPIEGETNRVAATFATNIFGDGAGGRFIADWKLTPQIEATVLPALWATIESRLKSNIYCLDAELENVFSSAALTKALADYKQKEPTPRLLGFFHYLASANKQSLQMRPALNGSAVDFTFALSALSTVSAQPPSQDIAVDKADAALANMCSKISSGPCNNVGNCSQLNVASAKPTSVFSCQAALVASFAVTGLDQNPSTSAPQVAVRFTSAKGVASMNLDFHSAVIQSARVTFDYSDSSSSIFIRTANCSDNTNFGLDSAGQLATDATKIIPNVLADALSEAAKNITTEDCPTRPLPPLNIVACAVDSNSTGIGEVLANVSDWLAAQSSPVGQVQLALKIEERIAEKLTYATKYLASVNARSFLSGGQAPSAIEFAAIRILPLPGGAGLSIKVSDYQLSTVLFQSSITEQISFGATLGRIPFPLVTTTTAATTIQANALVTSLSADTTGQTQVQGIVLPAAYRMYAGVASEGQISLDIASASQVELQVGAQILARDGAAFSFDFKAPNLAGDRSVNSPIFSVRSDPLRGVDPMQVYMNTLSMLKTPSRILQAPLNLPVAPLTTRYGDLTGEWDASVDGATTWLARVSDGSKPIAASDICVDPTLSVQLPFHIDATVNEGRAVFACTIAPPHNSLARFIAGFNSDLADCGLGNYLVVKDASRGDYGACGTLAMFSAVPGLVWSLEMRTDANLTLNQTIRYEDSAAFATWEDYIFFINSLFPTLESDTVPSRPQYTSMPTAKIPGFPEWARALYPAELPAVVYPVLYSVQAKNYISNATQSGPLKTSVAGTTVSLTFLNSTDNAGQARLDTDFSASVTTVLGGPPSGHMFISTCLEGNETYTPGLNFRLQAPNNTFTFQIEAELRFSPTNFTRISQKTPIVFPPGTTFYEAIATQFRGQLPPIVQQMISVRLVPAQPWLNVSEQLYIEANRTQFQGGWLLPNLIAISQTSIPGLTNATLPATSVRTLLSSVSIRQSIQSSVSATRVNGTIGVWDFKAAGTTAGNGLTTISLALQRPYEIMERFAGSSVKSQSLLNVLKVVVNSTSSVLTKAVSVLNQPTLPELQGLEFANHFNEVLTNNTGEANIKTFADSLADKWQHFLNDTEETTKQVFHDLAHMNTSSLCSVMRRLITTGEEVAASPLASVDLPFSSQSLGEVLQSTFVTPLTELSNQFCVADSLPGLGLDFACTALRKKYNSDICQNIVAADNTITFGLVLNRTASEFHSSQTVASKFKMNLGMFSKAFDNRPIGISASDNINFAVGSAFDFKIKVDFSNGLTIQVLPGSYVEAWAALSAYGSLRVSFGAFGATFGDAALKLGDPVALRAQLDASDKLNFAVDGSASLNALFNVFGKDLARFSMSVTNLQKFLQGDFVNSVTTTFDGSNLDIFIQKIDASFDYNALSDFFSDAFHLVSQIQSGLDSQLVAKWEQELGEFVAPLVDKFLTQFIQKELSGIVGPQEMNQIILLVTEMTNSLLINHTIAIDTTAVSRLILTEFTSILCQVIKPDTCPPVPEVNTDNNYRWPITISRTMQSACPILNFELGDRSFASLEANCNAQLGLNFVVTFDIVYKQNKGMSVEFPRMPVLDGKAALTLPNQCVIDGNIGFLGAAITANSTTDFTAEFRMDKIDKGWKPALKLHAALAGDTQLGFAGPLAKEVGGTPQALAAFPHFKMGLLVEFNCTLSSNPQDCRRPGTFRICDGTVCLGTMLGKVINGIGNEAERVLAPMKKLFDPNEGILMRTVPATKFIWGRPLRVVEFAKIVFDVACGGECVFDGVFDAIQTFGEIYYVLDGVAQLTHIGGDEGCDVVQAFHNFETYFQADDPFKTLYLLPDDRSMTKIDFKSGIPARDQDRISDMYTRVTIGGKFGISLPIAVNTPTKIIQCLMGVDVALVEVSIPTLTIVIEAHWGVPIWPFPYVELGIGVTVWMKVETGNIVYTTRGLRQLIETGSVPSLINGLAIRTRHDDGSQIFLLQGGIRVSGYVYVSLWLVDGQAYLFIELVGGLAVIDVNGDGLCSWDQFVWLEHVNGKGIISAMKGQLDLRAGFGIKIRMCLNLLFFKKCWDLISLELSATIWTPVRFGGAMYTPAVTPANAIYLPMMDQNQFKPPAGLLPHPTAGPAAGSFIVQISKDPHGVTQAAIYPYGVSTKSQYPPIYHNIGATSVIGYVASTSPVPPEYHIIGQIEALIEVNPNSATNFFMDPFPSSTVFSVTPTTITPSQKAAGVRFPGPCPRLQLSHPNDASLVSFVGVPGPVEVESLPSGSLSISGDPSLYSSKPITLLGSANQVNFAPLADRFVISPDALVANDGQVRLDLKNQIVGSVSVTGHPTAPSTFNVLATAPTTRLIVQSGIGDAQFLLPDLTAINGALELRGSSGINSVNLAMTADATTGLSVSSGKSALSFQKRHIVAWTNIQRKTFTLTAKPNVRNLAIYQPESGDTFVQINSFAPAGAIFEHVVTGCEGNVDYRLALNGTGHHRVVIGNQNKVDKFQCSIRISASAEVGQTSEIVINGMADEHPMIYSFDRGHIEAYDAALPMTNYMQLFASAVTRIIAGLPQSVKVTLKNVAEGTEYHFAFPNSTKTAQSTTRNQFVVCPTGTSRAVTITGANVDVTVGPVGCGGAGVTNALTNVFGSVAVIGPGMSVIIDAKNPEMTGPQFYGVNDTCLVPLDPATLATNIAITNISDWACKLRSDSAGRPWACQQCAVSYFSTDKDAPVRLQLQTYFGNDALFATGSQAILMANLGDGNDEVHLRTSAAPFQIDLGVGTDRAALTAPLVGGGQVSLGADNDPDIVNVYSTTYSPSMNSGNGEVDIGPVGPKSMLDRVQLLQYTLLDFAQVTDGEE